MSKRGSNNAIKFAGKNWKLSKQKTSSPVLDTLDKKPKKTKNKAVFSKKNKERVFKQFKCICDRFDFPLKDEDYELYKRLKNEFCGIKSNKLRNNALENIKSFNLYCKKYNEIFSIDNYFDQNFYLVNFKTDYPDVYYLNVSKTTQSAKDKNNKIHIKTNHLENNLNEDTIKKIKAFVDKPQTQL